MDIEEKLKEIFAKVLSIKKSSVSDKSSMNNTSQWDSFNHLLLINEIEKEFGIEIKSSDINSIRDFASLKSAVENSLKK